MRLVLMVLLSAMIQQTPQSQTGTIEGTVTRAGSTTVPIAGAQVKATGASDPLNPFILETTTDGAGRFSFSDVPAGQFRLEVSHEGYGYYRQSKFVFEPTQTVLVRVAPGQRVQAPRLSFIAAATIRGRVLDSEGKGVARLPIEFLRLTNNEQGRKVWAPTNVETETNDRGEYEHTMLGPGDYYVRTILDSESNLPIAVYYPEATDGNAAAPVVVGEGSQMVADIRTGPALNAPAYKVIGKVVHPFLNTATSSIELILMKRDSKEPIGSRDSRLSALSQADRDSGQFQFRGIRAGNYDLWAGAEIEGRQFLSKVPVEIRDRDIEDVNLTLRAGMDVKGRLVGDGNARDHLELFRRTSRSGDPIAFAGTVRIALNRKDGFPLGTAPDPIIDDNGVSFTFKAVPEGAYSVSISIGATERTPRNPDVYISDIRASGRSVFDTGFEVGTDPVDSMEIVVETGGGSIEGTLQGKSELVAAVVLAPDSFRRSNPSLYRSVTYPGNGKFRLNGIAPGNYKIFAVPYFNETVPYHDPEFLARHESRALSVTIRKGTTTSGLLVPYLSLGR